MKLSDDSNDKKNNRILGIVTGILCGLLIGYLVLTSVDASYIFFGILIGSLIAKKIDCINHVISSVTFLFITLIFGIPALGLTTLTICSIAAYIDEIGNDNKWISEKSLKLDKFFKYRFTLKSVILMLVVLGMLQNIYPVFRYFGIEYLGIYTFFYFLVFEISYELAGLKFDIIYDRVYSLFRVFGFSDGSSNN
jgi:hypothetical protein